VPLFIPLLIAVPFGPLLAWKRADLAGVTQRLLGAFVVALLGIAATLAIEGHPVLPALVVGLALYVMSGALIDIAERIGTFRVPLATMAARARGLPRSNWGTALAHFGLGVVLLGIVGETQWGAERIVAMKPSDRVTLRHYDFTFDGTVPRTGSNYRDLVARFTVRRDGEVLGTMQPAKRTFLSRNSTTTEAALMARGFSQLYVSLGDVGADGSIVVRIYHKPMVLMIWLGAVIMVIGGAFSLSDRRLRVGAPRPARSAAAMQPAE
jgi:cytochrome c-type biogenesis protein CcmF